MKKVILVTIAVITGALLISGCTKAQTAQAKKAETVSTTMHNHEGNNEAHNPAMKSDNTPKELVLQKTCPIMDNPINKDLYVDYDGKRIYLCCQTCVKEFPKNPEKHLKKLSELGEKPETL